MSIKLAAPTPGAGGGGAADLAVDALRAMDWDFAGVKTNYWTHGLHPYPAKFIPQIPNRLIQVLSSVGDTVLDPFCGSGTTLVEAAALHRNSIGLDANPIACLVSQAKTVLLDAPDVVALQELNAAVAELSCRHKDPALPATEGLGLDLDEAVSPPDMGAIQFWFEPHVSAELAQIKALCDSLPSANGRILALAAFSSILVAVSKQDSDTRYVRRAKNIRPGNTLQRFQRALGSALNSAVEFAGLVDKRCQPQVKQANVLAPPPDLGEVDLVVCSPPYPNAYSYHLYHMTRMIWLGIDPAPFKAIEIGSHRKYSRKGPTRATPETFKGEMRTVFGWLGRMLKRGGYACLVIGDSIVNGAVVRNHEAVSQVAQESGFCSSANIIRQIQDAKKSFNPAIGRIRQENILILRNEGGPDAAA